MICHMYFWKSVFGWTCLYGLTPWLEVMFSFTSWCGGWESSMGFFLPFTHPISIPTVELLEHLVYLKRKNMYKHKTELVLLWKWQVCILLLSDVDLIWRFVAGFWTYVKSFTNIFFFLTDLVTWSLKVAMACPASHFWICTVALERLDVFLQPPLWPDPLTSFLQQNGSGIGKMNMVCGRSMERK